jgi:ribonuclease HI
VILYTDGGCKPKTGTYGSFRIENDAGELREIVRWAEFDTPVETNNQAEYAILLEALLYVERMKPENITVYSDSLLMIQQLNGEYEIKNAALAEWAASVKEAMTAFEEVKLVHVPRKIIVEKLGH